MPEGRIQLTSITGVEKDGAHKFKLIQSNDRPILINADKYALRFSLRFFVFSLISPSLILQ